MARVIVTIKIMPESPDIDLAFVEREATRELENLGLEVGKKEIQPIAFGLNALIIYAIQEESLGSLDIEGALSKIEGINSVEIIDVRRAIG
ncbi:MAG: elongation factor 1-beta [Candidatus Woesearchaeota archaeon]